MRKSTIALAVAAALGATAVAQADTTLYGSARVSVDYQKADIFDPDEVDDLLDNDGVWDIVNNSSRLGVRGFEDLGDGLSAIYQFEMGVNVTDNTGDVFGGNRVRLVGLKHDRFGTASIGTQWTPYYNVAGITDVFNSGRTFDTSYLGTFRKDNSLVYLSPNFYGFTAEGMIQMDGAGGTEDGVDTWDAALRYQNGPIFAGAGYTSVEGDDGRDQWVGGLGYNIANFALGFTVEYGDANQFGNDDNVLSVGPDGVLGTADDVVVDGDKAWNYYGALSYTFGANIVRAAYGYIDPKNDLDETQSYAVGFQHNLSKRTRLWVEYIGNNTEDDLDFTGDQDAVSIGMRHDF